MSGLEVGASLVGSALGYLSQRDANKKNVALARENREWQERMSNTAYQRSAADLEAAGLNRILAFGSPATSPAGNVATVNPAIGPDVGDRAVNTAKAAEERKVAKANRWNVEADTRKKDAETFEIDHRTVLLREQTNTLIEDRVRIRAQAGQAISEEYIQRQIEQVYRDNPGLAALKEKYGQTSWTQYVNQLTRDIYEAMIKSGDLRITKTGKNPYKE